MTNSCVNEQPNHPLKCPLSFQPVLSVRTFVLNLTQRLHAVEKERRSLIARANHWQKEAGEMKGATEQTQILSRKVQELERVVSRCYEVECTSRAVSKRFYSMVVWDGDRCVYRARQPAARAVCIISWNFV